MSSGAVFLLFGWEVMRGTGERLHCNRICRQQKNATGVPPPDFEPVSPSLNWRERNGVRPVNAGAEGNRAIDIQSHGGGGPQDLELGILKFNHVDRRNFPQSWTPNRPGAPASRKIAGESG
jgi:hypothetical protein